MEYLKSKKAEVLLNNKTAKINFENDTITSIILKDNREIKTDFYIGAVPFFDFKNLIGESIYNRDYSAVNDLKSSPIVNIHLKFDRNIDDIFSERFAGLLNTRTQWIFKVKSDQLCLVISAAKQISEMDKEEIINIAKEELIKCIPGFKGVNITGVRVLKETRATFMPDKESIGKRPGNTTKFKNFFITGDWTDTGLPATIEGAVKSSKNCVQQIMSESRNLK
jgi:zeta-carotene desaturase